jgi:hypothetical protein
LALLGRAERRETFERKCVPVQEIRLLADPVSGTPFFFIVFF